ncbi:methyl-accepting chemotaxis protein [Treponema sp.]|uniref:methyl-accepting chemotaxis protein n=1 Tax=Treponema sp. TaxID=166 RepID=UPI00298DE460|nr:methyl-accepting chemotaxis protein [Treponema sp.]MCQ2240732.1 methyl-accepting chemotaxis protein [Treponema sp.]
MANKKRKSSVSTIMIATIVLGLAVFSVVLFMMISRLLNRGLEDYFQGELENSSELFLREIKTEENNLVKVQTSLIGTLDSIYSELGSFPIEFVDTVVESACRSFDVDDLTVYDENLNLCNSASVASSINKTEILNRALNGDTVLKVEKMGQDVKIVRAVPIKHGSYVTGVLVGMATATSQKFVERMKSLTGCDNTIFDGTTRAYTTLSGMRGSVIADPEPIRRAEQGNDFSGVTTIGGKKYVVYYFPMKNNEGKFLTTLWLGKELGIIDHVSAIIFKPLVSVTILLVLILLAILILIIYMRVIRPLKSVGGAMRRLASGDADLTIRLPVNGNDEFADISKNVNTFIIMLQTIVEELSAAQRSLTEIGQSLGANAQQSASATAQIMANIQGVRKQSENQSEAVANTTGVLGKSSTSMSALSELVENQSAGITESSAAIEEMLGNITSVTNSVHRMADSFNELGSTVSDGKNKLANVDGKVNEIAEQSKMLIQANQIIAQIASETNLLAMNAAIEAAHAGKAGEGFSVVANEIRKLAETSSTQSKNINAELKQISTSIKDVVSLSKDSQAAFAQIVTHLDSTDTIIREIDNAMNEQENASRQIFSALSDMRNQALEVSEMSREVNDGIVAVSRDMDSVSQISSIILGSMDEMTAGAQEISTASQSVADHATETRQNISVMQDKLGKFKI